MDNNKNRDDLLQEILNETDPNKSGQQPNTPLNQTNEKKKVNVRWRHSTDFEENSGRVKEIEVPFHEDSMEKDHTSNDAPIPLPSETQPVKSGKAAFTESQFDDAFDLLDAHAKEVESSESKPESNRIVESSWDKAPLHVPGYLPETTESYHTSDPLYEDLEGDSQRSKLPKEEQQSAAGTRRKRKRQEHRIISALVMTIIILVVSVGLSMVIITYGQDLLGINSDGSSKIVIIPSGSSMSEIATILEDEGIISHARFFVFIASMSDKDTDIKPGDHELRPDMAYETILSELTSESMDGEYSISVTITEGMRLVDAANLLEENGICDADEFLDYFNNDSTDFDLAYEDYLPAFQDEKFYVMEGYLFPDTYTFSQDMDVSLVCQKILTNFNSKITLTYYDRMEVMGITLDQTITLASIIQAEAGTTDDMATVSSVFWNRLNNATEFPLLQSDATSSYVEEVIKPHSETYDQELYDSYDTYTCTGLPAGAICNPGEDAIYAALYPENTGYYYFYSNLLTGETYFAKTLEEHDANQAMVAAENGTASSTSDDETDNDEVESDKDESTYDDEGEDESNSE